MCFVSIHIFLCCVCVVCFFELQVISYKLCVISCKSWVTSSKVISEKFKKVQDSYKLEGCNLKKKKKGYKVKD